MKLFLSFFCALILSTFCVAEEKKKEGARSVRLLIGFSSRFLSVVCPLLVTRPSSLMFSLLFMLDRSSPSRRLLRTTMILQ